MKFSKVTHIVILFSVFIYKYYLYGNSIRCNDSNLQTESSESDKQFSRKIKIILFRRCVDIFESVNNFKQSIFTSISMEWNNDLYISRRFVLSDRDVTIKTIRKQHFHIPFFSWCDLRRALMNAIRRSIECVITLILILWKQ